MSILKKNKKKMPALIAALLALAGKALAFIWLVIIILVLIVAGIIIYQIVKNIRRWIPDDGRNNVTRVWLNDGTYNDWVYDNAPDGYVAGSDGPTVAAAETLSFRVQYGVSSVRTNGPAGWVSIGEELNPVQFYESVGNDLSNYSFVMTSVGQAFRITCVDGIYHTDVLDMNTNTYVTVIERTTNFVTWEPIFTNATLGVYSVEPFDDTNAPPDKAYYRLNIARDPN